MDISEILQEIIRHNLNPNQYYVLSCLRNKVVPIKVYSNIDVRELISNEFLTEKYIVTDKGLEILSVIDKLIANDSKSLTKQISITEENVEKYLNIFPEGKLPSGKYARSNNKNIQQVFKWFFANYNYSWETVYMAAQNYVEQYQRTNYLYMRTAQYFIRKQESDRIFRSELADYCESINKTEDDNSKHFMEKVV